MRGIMVNVHIFPVDFQNAVGVINVLKYLYFI